AGLGARAVLEPREHARPGAGYARAERVVVECGPLDRREAGDQRRPTRFDQHVGEAGAHEPGIAAMAAREHEGEVRALRDEAVERMVAGEHGARATRLEDGMRVHERTVPG